MESSQEERPVAKRLRSRTIFIKEDGPVATKRRRTGNHDSQNLESKVDENLKQLIPLNGEQIIQEKQRILEDLKQLQASKSKSQAQILGHQAQIAEIDTRTLQLQDQLKELMDPLLTKLPDEILLKILGYLSSYDVLRNVARVSKKFKELSEDPFLIRKIEMHKGLSTIDQVTGCLKVLQTSKNLTFFSFDLNWDFDAPAFKIFLNALPTFNHQNLEEFYINGHYGCSKEEFEQEEVSLLRKLLVKYLKKCPNLKILKIEFEEEITASSASDNYDVTYCDLGWLRYEGIFKRMKFQNLEELHFNGFDWDLDPEEFTDIFHKFQKNLPKLRRLCFQLDNIENLDEEPEYDEIFQEFASEKNVKIEITGTPIYTSRCISEKYVKLEITGTPVKTYTRILEVEHPSSGFKIFNPMPK